MNIWGRRARRFPLCFVMNFVVFADSGAAAERGLPPTVFQMDFSRCYCWSWFNLSPRSRGVFVSAPGTGDAPEGAVLGTRRFWGQRRALVTGGAVPSVEDGGAGTPTASAAALWPLRHHPGDIVTIETSARSGWERRGMWQPPNPPGAGDTVPEAPKIHGGLVAAVPTHPRLSPPSSSWHPLEFAPGICPALGRGSRIPCPHLCQALPSRSCQAASPPGAQTQNLKGCLDLLNVAAFVCFLPSVFQILRFLPSVLQIFRV